MKTILVVDDNSLVRQTLSNILTSSGYHVVTASGPAEAVQFCNETTFDLALCDLQMPNVELSQNSVSVGMTVISYLTSKFPRVPVIAISGELPPEHLSKMEKFGAVDAIAKPFCVDELLGKIADSIGS